MQYWFNVNTGRVEDDTTRSRGEIVMGPYDTAEEAARAMEIARERTEKWDEEDAEWDARGRRTHGDG